MKTISRLLVGSSKAVSVFSGLAVILLTLHVSIDVFLRYAFNAPLSGTILYVSAFYMVAIAFLPQALVEKDENHISVELIYDYFPPFIRKSLLAISFLLTAIVGGLIAVRTGQEALGKYALGTFSLEGRTKIITWPTYFIPPLGFGLMALVAFWKFLTALIGVDDGLRDVGDDEAELLVEENPNV